MKNKILVAVCESQKTLENADGMGLVILLDQEESKSIVMDGYTINLYDHECFIDKFNSDSDILNNESDYIRFIQYTLELNPVYTILD